MKYFYHKYIVIENLVTELHSLDLNQDERLHLASLVDSSLHHAILDEILSSLKPEDKKLFLQQIANNPEDEKIVDFLNQRIENIEDRIKKVSDDLVTEMHQDIKEAKRIKSNAK